MAFEGFSTEMIPTAGTRIHTLRKGSGPPLLLLHGYPQTHFIWHEIAERLAEKYTVVLTDLRGYGDPGSRMAAPVMQITPFVRWRRIRSR